MVSIAQLCQRYVSDLGLTFSFKGDSISYDDIFRENGLLAALAKRADSNATVALGYGIGAHYTINDDSLLGVTVEFDTSTPTSLRLAFLVDALEELKSSASDVDGVIALDELLYE